MAYARTLLAGRIAGDSGIGDESAQFTDENTDGRFYTEDENIHVVLEFSHKYVSNYFIFITTNVVIFFALGSIDPEG